MHHSSILWRYRGGVLLILVYLCSLSSSCNCNKDIYTPEPSTPSPKSSPNAPSSPTASPSPTPPAPPGTPGKVVDLNGPALKTFIKSISPTVSLQRLLEASQRFSVTAGSITDEPKGIIQDPAGSAVGSGTSPSGSGLSGAIYGKFKNLAPIPNVTPGQSVFNPNGSPDSKRILHTHSPNLSAAAGDLGKAVALIKDAYLNAIKVFVSAENTVEGTPQVKTLLISVLFLHQFMEHLSH